MVLFCFVLCFWFVFHCFVLLCFALPCVINSSKFAYLSCNWPHTSSFFSAPLTPHPFGNQCTDFRQGPIFPVPRDCSPRLNLCEMRTWCGNCSLASQCRSAAERGLFVCWLLNVPATCECISGTDLLRQFLRAATLR